MERGALPLYEDSYVSINYVHKKEDINYALEEMSFLLEVNYLKSFQEVYIGAGLKEIILYSKKVLDL